MVDIGKDTGVEIKGEAADKNGKGQGRRHDPRQ